jgi:hypothetical protein
VESSGEFHKGLPDQHAQNSNSTRACLEQSRPRCEISLPGRSVTKEQTNQFSQSDTRLAVPKGRNGASETLQSVRWFHDTSLPRELADLILQNQSLSSSSSPSQILQTSGNPRGRLMPETRPDILDQAYVLFLSCLFCVGFPTRWRGRPIFPSIRRPVTDAATSAQLRRFGTGFVLKSLREFEFAHLLSVVRTGSSSSKSSTGDSN